MDLKITPTKDLKGDIAIQVLIDASGSMGSIANDTMTGYNTFIEQQRKEPGVALVSLTLFESGNVTKVYEAMPIDKVPTLTRDVYRVGGGTPLLDAVGDAIEAQTAILERTERADGAAGNPDSLMLIMTDGEENSSRHRSTNDIKEMVEGRESTGWTFVYMGADHNSWAQTSGMGFSAHNTVDYSRGNVEEAFGTLSAATSHYRATSTISRGMGAEMYETKAFFNDAGIDTKSLNEDESKS